MDDQVKKCLTDAIFSGSLETVQYAFGRHTLILDNSFIDYDLVKLALNRKHEKIVHFLLTLGSRVINPNEPNSETPLHLAMKLNDELKEKAIIKNLLKYGASIYSTNCYGETPLLAAFNNGNYRPLRIVLSHIRASYNTENEYDILHFHIACVINHYNAVKNFLKCGLNPNKPLSLKNKEYFGLNPVEFAIQQKYSELFELFLGYNRDRSIKKYKDSKGLIKLTIFHVIYYNINENYGEAWIEKAFNNGDDSKFINIEDKYGVSHFYFSCLTNNTEFVKRFLDKGIDVNGAVSLDCPVNPGYTALHFAVHKGCLNIVKLLLRSGADPNKTDKQGETSLHLACKSAENVDKNAMIEELLYYKANIVTADVKGCTPIHTSFYFSIPEGILNSIITWEMQWISTNYTDEQGLSLFHIACTGNDINRVKQFLDSGVNIDSCVTSGTYIGYTGLHFAVMFNKKNIVQFLLEKKAKVNVSTGKPQVTPLHLACAIHCTIKIDEKESVCEHRSEQFDIIKMLLLHGADVDAKDSLGNTPLLHACMIDVNHSKLNSAKLGYSNTKTRNELYNEISIRLHATIEMLISNNADVNARSENQSTLLHVLSKYSNLKISEKLMKLLIIAGVDVDAVDDAGLTPLHVAVNYNNNKLVKSLLKNNANPNVKCKNSRIPIHTAIERVTGKIKNGIFCALLESGSDVNVRDQNDRIMLHNAMTQYSYLVIEKLLCYGADVNKEDSKGNSFASHVFDWDTARREYLMGNLCSDLFRLCYIHIQKLVALGLPVSQKVQDCCNQLYPRYKDILSKNFKLKNIHLEKIYDDCVKELDTMKNVKIDKYTSLYDILRKSPQELAIHVKNRNFIKIQKDKNIENIYPLYHCFVRLQFIRGSLRSNVLQSAEESLSKALGINLPSSCTNLMFRYLENEDIVHLKAAAVVKRSLKRKLSDADIDDIESVSKSKRFARS